MKGSSNKLIVKSNVLDQTKQNFSQISTVKPSHRQDFPEVQVYFNFFFEYQNMKRDKKIIVIQSGELEACPVEKDDFSKP